MAPPISTASRGQAIEDNSLLEVDLHNVAYLTTVGRISRRPHRIEIWFAHHNSRLYMLSGGGLRSDWVENIINTPHVSVEIGQSEYRGVARLVSDPTEDRLARSIVFDKYNPSYGGDLTKWREAAAPVAIDLVELGE